MIEVSQQMWISISAPWKCTECAILTPTFPPGEKTSDTGGGTIATVPSPRPFSRWSALTCTRSTRTLFAKSPIPTPAIHFFFYDLHKWKQIQIFERVSHLEIPPVKSHFWHFVLNKSRMISGTNETTCFLHRGQQTTNWIQSIYVCCINESESELSRTAATNQKTIKTYFISSVLIFEVFRHP